VILTAADCDLLDGDAQGAFTRLVAAVRATTGDERTAVRDRLVEQFAMLGDEDPRVVAARRELASALF
jgi:putative thioredoxin